MLLNVEVKTTFLCSMRSFRFTLGKYKNLQLPDMAIKESLKSCDLDSDIFFYLTNVRIAGWYREVQTTQRYDIIGHDQSVGVVR